MPVVHIVWRQNFDALVNKEKDMSDTAPVIAPSYNRSGEQIINSSKKPVAD
jgi:hypothetical protein